MGKQTAPNEHKVMTAFVTSVDEAQGVVTAIVNTFGVIDDGNDVVHPGAFVKTISERAGRVKVLDQHNTDSILRVIGKPISMREVGRAELPAEVLAQYPEATGGLETTTQYLLDTPEGKGAFQRIAARAVNEYSIGYDALDVDYSKTRGRDGKEIVVRNLRTIRLWEYSPVIWGMNPATATTGAKGVDGMDETKEEKMDETTLAAQSATTTKSEGTALGPYLTADLYGSVTNCASYLLRGGRIGVNEVLAIHSALEPAIQAFLNTLPAEVAEMELERREYGYMSAGEPGEGKAGRRINRANRDRLMGMYNAIRQMLEEDGWSLTDEEMSDSSDEDSGDMGKSLTEEVDQQSLVGAGSSSASPTHEVIEGNTEIPSFDEL